MTYNRNYLAKVPVSGNTDFVINYNNGSATQEGAFNLWSYNGKSAGDNQAAISADDYFVSDVLQFQLNDYIFTSATDAPVLYRINSITYPDNNGSGASVTVDSFAGVGTVTTADIIDHAVTYIKMQQVGADKLLGNPTGSSANVSEITLGTNLSFSGSTLNSTNSGGTVTSVATGTGLTGGPITTTGTISLANTAVTAGSYTLASITLDAQGRATAASNGTAVTSVATGTGLTGGPITTTGTVSLANTAVSPGSYTLMNATVDAQGRLTAATNGSAVTSVATGTGLTGGPITGSGTISLDNTSVTAGSYTLASVTFDAQGRATAASNGSAVTSVATSAGLTGGTITTTGTVGLDASYLKKTVTTISAAAFKNLAVAPVQIVPADSDPSKSIYVDKVFVVLNYNSVTYADGSNLNIQYGNSTAGTGQPLAAFNIAAGNFLSPGSACFDSEGAICDGSARIFAGISDVANAGIYITVEGADFTTGDSTITFTTWYRVI